MSRKKDHSEEKFCTDPLHILNWLRRQANQAHLVKISKATLAGQLSSISTELEQKISKINVKPAKKKALHVSNSDSYDSNSKGNHPERLGAEFDMFKGKMIKKD